MHPNAEGRRALLLFLATVTTAAVLVFAGGWLTGLRQVMHAALLAVAVVAFLPLVIVAAGVAVVAILFAVSVVLSLLGDGAVDVSTDGGLIEAGARAAPGYYRFMAARFVARRKHPVFWGLPLGTLVGGLALWGVLAAYVLPGEAKTAETLVLVQWRIDAEYLRRSRYPAPDENGHLRYESLGDAGPGAGVVLDGFGRPVEYRKTGHWKVASYRLRSYGYDGEPGGNDDLCRAGATTLGRLAEIVRLGRGPGGKGVSVSVRLGAIREAQCAE